jgi:hypothetical protein
MERCTLYVGLETGRVGSGFALPLTGPYRVRAIAILGPAQPVNPRVRVGLPDGLFKP